MTYCSKWLTLQVDSKVFDADKGNEAVLREMVNTVGKPGAAGEAVRCIVSVNMLSEGWDVKSITHTWAPSLRVSPSHRTDHRPWPAPSLSLRHPQSAA